MSGSQPGTVGASGTSGGAGGWAFESAQAVCQGAGIDHAPLDRAALPGSRPIGYGGGSPQEDLEAVPPESLDYVFSSHFLHTIEDWSAWLLAWNVVLRPGGQLFLYLPHPDCEAWRRGSDLVDERHRWVPTPAALASALPAAGYHIVTLEQDADPHMGFTVVAEKQQAVDPGRGAQLAILAAVVEKNSQRMSLARLQQGFSTGFVGLMGLLNQEARRFDLRQLTNWSKIWEYPWLWHHVLADVDWQGARLLDIGSEISPVPWFLASLGADVTMIETDPQWIPRWEKVRRETGLPMRWHIIKDENLPAADSSMDVVTSFSVIEHQPDKARAVQEVVRVLRTGGTFAVSFDICEPTMGMTFPEWNGSALTMAQFEQVLWNNPAFDTAGIPPTWDLDTIPEFIRWHLKAADHHNYTVAAAVLRKS
ncbi:MAG: class I SAM-dependent methyltransferase [Planctomycetota bacterium]